MRITSYTSNLLDYLKCLLCIGVVLIHAQFTPKESLLFGSEWLEIDYSLFNSFIRFFTIDFLNNTCVPVFFSISGFLFFHNVPDKIDKYFWKWYKNKLYSRVFSLLIPYLISNTIFMLLSEYVRHEGVRPLLSAYWSYTYGVPTNVPTWFLRDLMVACVLSPIILILLRKLKFVPLIILFLLWFFGVFEGAVPGLSFYSLLFFSIGSHLSILNVDILRLMNVNRFGWLYVVFYFSFLIFTFMLDNDYLIKLSVLLAYPAWFAFAAIIDKYDICKNKLKEMVAFSFFVFLFHYFYLTVGFTRLFLYIGGTSEIMCFVAYFGGTVLLIIFMWIIYRIMNFVTPSFVNIIVGDRKMKY